LLDTHLEYQELAIEKYLVTSILITSNKKKVK